MTGWVSEHSHTVRLVRCMYKLTDGIHLRDLDMCTWVYVPQVCKTGHIFIENS